MTWTSTLALCAASFGAGIVTMGIISSSRLSAAIAETALYKAWWERDSARAIVAEAQVDLTRQQRIDAGKAAHAPLKALQAERTDDLRRCIAQRQLNTLPAVAEPATGIPAGAQRPPKKSGTEQVGRSTGQDTGRELPPHVTPRASDRNPPVDTCRRNRAGHFAPAETPKMKGAI